jgi:serine/threonine-protein kinase
MGRCEQCGYEPFESGKPCPSCSSSDAITCNPKIAGDLLIGGAISPPVDHQYEVGYSNAGRYKIERFLGAGGMGSVYKVYDTVENRPLALKILHNSMAGEEDGVERFKREFEILSKIHNASILRVYAWGKHEEELYFVSEFVDGTDLKSAIRGRVEWPASEAAELIAAVADALSVAHAKGIVHAM